MKKNSIASNNESLVQQVGQYYSQHVDTITTSFAKEENGDPSSTILNAYNNVEHQISIAIREIPSYIVEGSVYHDCSQSDVNSVRGLFNFPQIARRKGPRGGVAVPFPVRLHILLENQEDDEVRSIVFWQPHGRSFRVQNIQNFVATVMPR
jgi:hypothetical protein